MPRFKIYVITSPSGKQYVGKTKRKVKFRWKNHVLDAKKRVKNHTVFQKAILKYGNDAFTIDVLCKLKKESNAKRKERFYIKKLNTLMPNGYNMSEGGEGGVFGKIHTKKMGRRVSKAKKKYYSNPENREAQSERMSIFFNTKKGKKIQRANAIKQNEPEIKRKTKLKLKRLRSTKEYREAKSIEQKLVWSNPKLLKKHSKIMKDQYKNGRVTWNKGVKTGSRSEETKKKISESLKQHYNGCAKNS